MGQKGIFLNISKNFQISSKIFYPGCLLCLQWTVDSNNLSFHGWNLEFGINNYKVLHLHELAAGHLKDTQNVGKWLVRWNCPEHYCAFNINVAYPLKASSDTPNIVMPKCPQFFRISPQCLIRPCIL